MEQLYFKSAADWRGWLKANHDQSNGIWMVFYKKETGKPTIEYETAVEEALCYGWIDSIIKKIDEEKYVRKFTPRKDDSMWSAVNKKRVEKLIKEKRMSGTGLAKVETAKANGQWDKPDRPVISFELHAEFKSALDQNPKARAFFEQLAPSYKKHYMGWIAAAKQEKTREKRIQESIALLEKGKKLGMK